MASGVYFVGESGVVVVVWCQEPDFTRTKADTCQGNLKVVSGKPHVGALAGPRDEMRCRVRTIDMTTRAGSV